MKALLSLLILWVLSQPAAAQLPKFPLEKLTLPSGYKIEVYAKVPGARSLNLAPDGRLFVGTRGDKVYVVEKGKVKVFAKDLTDPNGIAFKDGKLYVAEVDRVIEIDEKGKQRILPQKFPSDKHHGWKFIRFGPDGKLYVPVGAPCNVCDTGTEYARIFKIDVNGTSKEEVAQGVRNTVGFDWNPQTKELWFTDNGRDMLGDDVPPDEINRVGSQKNPHFGFPFCHGKNISDPEFGNKKLCSETIPPEAELRAHVASLGMRFWNGNILLAEHGSWNRTKPQGYRLTLATLKDGKITKTEAFVDGWLQNGERWGRPVDVEIDPKGNIFVSDDFNGVIYRIWKK